jgi:hypothetical protein
MLADNSSAMLPISLSDCNTYKKRSVQFSKNRCSIFKKQVFNLLLL